MLAFWEDKTMPNQRAVAEAAGVTQATVSLALRGSPLISPAIRNRVLEEATRLGYRRNSYISSLMAHIRAGKPVRDRGVIAILVDAKSYDTWFYEPDFQHQTYRRQYDGMVKRAEELGFQTECFFLDEAGASKGVERILRARGIISLILGAPCRSFLQVPLQMSWERYACAISGYTWSEPKLDRVSTHHRHNVDIAYRQLLSRGYRRIGMSLPPLALEDADSNWFAAHFLWDRRFPKSRRIPLFVGKPGVTPISKFRRWLDKWRPEVLVCLLEHERIWIHEMGLRVPQDLQVVCLNRPRSSTCAGVDEGPDRVGAGVVDMVATRTLQNEYGIPPHPKFIQIEGAWVEGETLTSPP
jgi:LacI family transcriptional regulator